MTETASGPARGSRAKGSKASKGLRIERIHTTPGVHPYDEVVWERRDVVMTNWRDGSVNFEQRGVEFPDFWSVNAVSIVTSKYFRGAVGTPQRESSLKQLIDRVVKTYRQAGEQNGYFASPADAEIFEHELAYAVLHQIFAFNSPVWFNVGTKQPQQVSACFILSVDDSMESILDWYKEEGMIFKGGSGAGLNLSRIRSSKELLSSGGNASGPVSFMRGADASAGTIKSGGATRRAAKMVVLDVDHPDVEAFIETKVKEEEKIRALRDAGFDMDLGGDDITSVQYQNANNSVRVTDDFMKAVQSGSTFGLRARMTGEVVEEVDARELFRKMAEAAHVCADPGIQYDDTINRWHTSPESGRITASNPCFPADQRVVTDKGLIRIGELVRRSAEGETFAVYTNDVTAQSGAQNRVVATNPSQYLVTGTNEIVELRFSDGSQLRCTPNHRVWTANRGWVPAGELGDDDRVVRSFKRAERPAASRRIPAAALQAARAFPAREEIRIPAKWDEDLAHYLGWLVGDGCVTDDAAVTVYGSETDRAQILPRHQEFLSGLVGYDYTPSDQSNGTAQLRVTRGAFLAFAKTLGVESGRSAAQRVPEALFEAPDDALTAFLQGLFDADGRVVNQLGKGTWYVGLGSRSQVLLEEVQEILASLGIASRIYKEGTTKDSFSYVRKDGTEVTYSSDGPVYDLRISGRSIREFASRVGFSLPGKREKLRDILDSHTFYDKDETVGLVSRKSCGFETTYNLTEPRNHSYIVSGVVVANCSEYMHLDNSSCNLASLNLMKFLRDDDRGNQSFDAERFAKVVELVITAMDISICFADFPTEKIGETTRAFRQLGIGYANLGALLMATGHAYDSDGGRALAGAVTSLMTGTSYKRSAELAAAVGPYEGYARNSDAHKRVMKQHADANDAAKRMDDLDTPVWAAATESWQDVMRLGKQNGFRNAQASVLAPTGTIGLMMDCDTTGVEPDLALVKFKKLVGGGSMQIVNNTVPKALKRLGYQPEQAEAVVEYIAEHGNVIDAPGLKPQHYEVFDCAMGERSISPMGHVRMMAAAQPFLSGAISKTVNMPASSTVEDVQEIYLRGWKLGTKALAVYVENSKVGQPLSAKRQDAKAEAKPEPDTVVEYRPVRNRLPKGRPGITTSFTVGGAEGYMTANSYPDDGLGEVFLKMSKQGSTLAGMMDAFSIAVSVGLQYGVPLETYVSKFTNMRFEPAGMTDDPDVRMAQSIVDYIFRRLALDFLPFETRSALGIHSAEERRRHLETGSYEPVDDEAGVEAGVDVEGLAQSAPRQTEKPSASESSAPAAAVSAPAQAHSSTELVEMQLGLSADAPLCFSCGTKMRRAGSCYLCEGCGSTSGCS